MFGIIGIVSRWGVAKRRVDGLRRMEYRGYDSAGICTLNDGALVRHRSVGKLANFSRPLEGDPAPGDAGIEHTPWATHGVPTVANARPHANGEVAIVRNGIIGRIGLLLLTDTNRPGQTALGKCLPEGAAQYDALREEIEAIEAEVDEIDGYDRI